MNIGVGQTIGQYHLESLIGHGNMADVYQATHVRLGRPTAIKVIYPHLLGQPGFLERFKREAEVMARMRHPHIVRVHEFVCQDDMAYLVMEYVGGGTLETQLEQRRTDGEGIPLPDVLGWIEAIGSAVDHAHIRGLVHRDLKPANILFRERGDRRGSPVLTDFGLAYLADRPRISSSDSITGTPAYLSPEQARGTLGDARSDVYSLGVILYEMLTGQTPFQGNTVSVVMKHISEPPPSPRLLGCYLPAGVEAVVMRALAKKPAERYQSARALARALRAAVELATPAPASVPDDPAPDTGEKQAPPVSNQEAGRPATPARQTFARGRTTGTVATAPATADQSPRTTARQSSGLRRLGVAVIGLLLLAAVVGLGWWGSIQADGTRKLPTGPPQFTVFSAGSQVRISVPEKASVSVLRGCPTGFWVGVMGVATDGESGHVLARKGCESEWWYQVSLPALATDDWDGVGWVAGQYLEPR